MSMSEEVDMCEGCCVRDELSEIKKQLDELIEFTNVVKAGIAQAASAGGIQGMMIRQAVPASLLASLPKVG